MRITAMSAIDFTIKAYNHTQGLYYDHAGQVQLYDSEWELVTYVNASKLETTYKTLAVLSLKQKECASNCHLNPFLIASQNYF
jgi:hypothetical protein